MRNSALQPMNVLCAVLLAALASALALSPQANAGDLSGTVAYSLQSARFRLRDGRQINTSEEWINEKHYVKLSSGIPRLPGRDIGSPSLYFEVKYQLDARPRWILHARYDLGDDVTVYGEVAEGEVALPMHLLRIKRMPHLRTGTVNVLPELTVGADVVHVADDIYRLMRLRGPFDFYMSLGGILGPRPQALRSLTQEEMSAAVYETFPGDLAEPGAWSTARQLPLRWGDLFVSGGLWNTAVDRNAVRPHQVDQRHRMDAGIARSAFRKLLEAKPEGPFVPYTKRGTPPPAGMNPGIWRARLDIAPLLEAIREAEPDALRNLTIMPQAGTRSPLRDHFRGGDEDGDAPSSLAEALRSGRMQPRRGEGGDVNFAFRADHIMIKYTYTDGRDLDTRTRMLQPGNMRGYLGWQQLRQYPSGSNPILSWGGDNTGPGTADGTTAEAVLIDLGAFRRQHPDASEIALDMRAFWYGTRGTRPVVLEATLFRGGRIVRGTPRHQFSNPTAEESMVVDSTGRVVRSTDRGSGERVAVFRYNLRTGRGGFSGQ